MTTGSNEGSFWECSPRSSPSVWADDLPSHTRLSGGPITLTPLPAESWTANTSLPVYRPDSRAHSLTDVHKFNLPLTICYDSRPFGCVPWYYTERRVEITLTFTKTKASRSNHPHSSSHLSPISMQAVSPIAEGSPVPIPALYFRASHLYSTLHSRN